MQLANRILIIQSASVPLPAQPASMVLVIKESLCGCSLRTNTRAIGIIMTVSEKLSFRLVFVN